MPRRAVTALALATLTLVKDGERIPLAVGYEFEFTDKDVYCAQIVPSVKKGRTILEYVHFNEFMFGTNKIKFDGSFVTLKRGTEFTIRIMQTPGNYLVFGYIFHFC